MERIGEFLRNRPYPGRGIMLGATADMNSLTVIYFIMGRSENSRNRIFEAEGRSIKIRAFDEAKLKDPSLVIYYPLKICGNMLILTNGDQTDTIYTYIREGHSFEDALRTRTYEPDSLCTPRISGILDLADGSYRLNILKTSPCGDCLRFFYEYPLTAGHSHFISTYDGDNDNPSSFSGEPLSFEITSDIDEMSSLVWDNLNEDNKVSLFVRYIDRKTKESVTRIVNRN